MLAFNQQSTISGLNQCAVHVYLSTRTRRAPTDAAFSEWYLPEAASPTPRFRQVVRRTEAKPVCASLSTIVHPEVVGAVAKTVKTNTDVSPFFLTHLNHPMDIQTSAQSPPSGCGETGMTLHDRCKTLHVSIYSGSTTIISKCLLSWRLEPGCKINSCYVSVCSTQAMPFSFLEYF